MEGNMITLAYAVMACWLVANKVEALKCTCSYCPTGVCTVSSHGGSCYAQLFLVNSIQVQPIVRGCYADNAASETYCGTDVHSPINGTSYSGYLKIGCCRDEDECNREGELDLTVSPKPTTAPSTTASSPSTTASSPSTSSSSPSTTTSSPSTTASSPSTKDDARLVCHTYNSKKSDYRSFCEADGGFCYWLVRRNKTGHVTQQRQGCSDTCQLEDCKHLTRHCCNTSHCNAFPDDKPTDPPAVATAGSSGSFSSSPLPSPQVSPSSQESSSSGDGDIIPLLDGGLSSSPVVTTIGSSSSSSPPMPSSQPLCSSQLLSTSSQPVPSSSRPLPSSQASPSSQESSTSGDSDARSLLNDEQNRSPVVPTASSTSSFFSQPLPSSQLSLLSQESSVDGDTTSSPTSDTASLEVSPYLVASLVLGALYLLILIVLMVLVAAVCIRQRHIAQSLQDKTSLYSQSTSSTSV